ncbi:head-tail connector protein [Sphingomonas quercus]|uniref:Phage gp6-like head-tail connector protein n=1 Tax=Sphingomonas quercus TaxID=2842451 RepID=A0ABS6BLH0_9SPHN|nr:hypothetical protein [Sphingomonas quercus]MBU3078472.1 hypothetical protein [Sphingomonas quercus]
MEQAAVEQAKAYLRIADPGEDAVIEGLVASALGLCEAFLGQVPIARTVTETLPVRSTWQPLMTTPVRAIVTVEGVGAGGGAAALPVDAYAIDLDAQGRGWLRVGDAGSATAIRVTAEVGLAGDWASLPEAIRQGVVRLAAHFFTRRDAAGEDAPPAVVAALWRPWRRMRLS